jgi:hypothetical protein
MSEQKELTLRLEAKKKEFQAELASIKNDMTGSAKKSKDTLESKIKEITGDLRNAKEDFSEKIAKKFNEWLE